MLLGREAGVGVGNTKTCCTRQVPAEGQEARPGLLLLQPLCGPSLRHPCLCLLEWAAGSDDCPPVGTRLEGGAEGGPPPRLPWSSPPTDLASGGLALLTPQSLAVTHRAWL